ncbi:MAG: FecR domain-containing protein [Bacteroidota bacterium]
MAKYEHFDLEDFAADDYFINWCIHPDEASDQFWAAWMQNHPDQKYKILEAKQLVLDIHAFEKESYQLLDENKIWNRIENQITTTEPKRKNKTLQTFWIVSSIAAVFLLAVVFFLMSKNEKTTTDIVAKVAWTKFDNTTGITQTITLPDGSTVELEPFSYLKYPKTFVGTQRKVMLRGEAFFNIQRDTTAPFMVYANETITKVLGTSFRVIAFEGNQKVEVEVTSGRVAVYANVGSDKQLDKAKKMIIQADEPVVMPLPNKKLEVTPNQKVVFDKEAEAMTKAISAAPVVIAKKENIPQLVFDNESIVKVFESLEIAYGIQIDFDQRTLENCTITTELDDEPLFQKLSIICLALNLDFTRANGKIFIKGEGC